METQLGIHPVSAAQEELAFLPLHSEAFPPLTPELRAALGAYRELEGAVSGLTQRQQDDRRHATRMTDDLRSLDSKLNAARDQKFAADSLGQDSTAAARKLDRLHGERMKMEQNRAGLLRVMNERGLLLEEKNKALTIARKRLDVVKRRYGQKCLADMRDSMGKDPALQWFRLWAAFGGNLRLDDNHWWMQTFLGLTGNEIREAVIGGERDMADYLRTYPLDESKSA